MGGNGLSLVSNGKKEMLRSIFNVGQRMNLRTAATQSVLHHMTIWHFLNRKLKLYTHKLQMHQETCDLERQCRILFARYCRTELRNNPETITRLVFSDESYSSISGTFNKQNCLVSGLESPKKAYIECLAAGPCYGLVHGIEKRNNWAVLPQKRECY